MKRGASPVRECRYGCAGPARFYLRGWLCVAHAPAPPPVNPGPTLADLVARRIEAAAAAALETGEEVSNMTQPIRCESCGGVIDPHNGECRCS